MLYKLVIVEDENAILDGLANHMEWESLGFKVVGTFEDGGEAIDYIKKNPVDVILTDIKLTFVSGLELAEYIHKNKPKIKVVIISGYKKFDYARQAVQYDVAEYIIKPIKNEKIASVFDYIKTMLDKESQEKSKSKKYREHFFETIPLLRQQFFKDLLVGALKNKNEIEKKINLLDVDIDLMTSRCCLINFSVDSLNTSLKIGKEELKISICKLVREEQQENLFIPIRTSDIYYLQVLVISKVTLDENIFKKKVNAYIKNVSYRINSIFSIDFSVSGKYFYNNILELSYQNQSKDINKNIKNGKENFNKDKFLSLQEHYKLFMSYINDGNYDAVFSLLDTVINKFDNTDLKYCKNFIVDLFSQISNKLKEVMGIDLYLETRGNFDYIKLLKLKNIHEIKKMSKFLFENIKNCLTQGKKSYQNKVIETAKKYIKENYSQDLSLEDVADQVFLCSVYFSRLFKKDTGINFVDYLTNVRIEKAKELLKEDNIKIYQISERVGYKNSKYFSRLFKKHCGLSPSEYRKKFRVYRGA